MFLSLSRVRNGLSIILPGAGLGDFTCAREPGLQPFPTALPLGPGSTQEGFLQVLVSVHSVLSNKILILLQLVKTGVSRSCVLRRPEPCSVLAELVANFQFLSPMYLSAGRILLLCDSIVKAMGHLLVCQCESTSSTLSCKCETWWVLVNGSVCTLAEFLQKRLRDLMCSVYRRSLKVCWSFQFCWEKQAGIWHKGDTTAEGHKEWLS